MQTLIDHITQSQVLARLHAIIKTRTQASLAEDIGISRSFLNEVIKGARGPRSVVQPQWSGLDQGSGG